MTKEEILAENEIGSNSLYYNRCMEAMDQYAKQQVIEFETWRRNKNIFLMDEIGQMPFGKYETPEELVNQYLKSKKTNDKA